MKNLILVLVGATVFLLSSCTKDSELIDTLISSEPTVEVIQFNSAPIYDGDKGDQYDAVHMLPNDKLYKPYIFKNKIKGYFNADKELKMHKSYGIMQSSANNPGTSTAVIYSDTIIKASDLPLR
jgi:hypothetical protein